MEVVGTVGPAVPVALRSRRLARGRPPSIEFPAPTLVGSGGGTSMGVLGLHKAISGHMSVPEMALPVAAPCAVTSSRSHVGGQHLDVSHSGHSRDPVAVAACGSEAARAS